MRHPSEDLSEDRLGVLRTLFGAQFDRLAAQSGFLLSEADRLDAARRSTLTDSIQTQEETSPRG